MTTDLTEQSLIDLIVDINSLCQDREKLISIKPTCMIMFAYPDETEEDFKLRVAHARAIELELRNAND